MKKRELDHLIREAITEGVMDNLTTQISRVIVNHLKQHRAEENVPTLKGQVGDLLVQAQFGRYNGPLKQAGGSYNDAFRRITVNIAVPYEFSDRQLSAFVPDLKNTIRHELEHHQQDKRSGYEGPDKGVHYTEPGIQDHPGYNPAQDHFATSDAAYNYFFSPIEIEAWVMGMYKQAKTARQPLFQVMQGKRGELVRNFIIKRMDRDEAQELADSLLQAWTDYAKKRIPGFKVPFGMM